MKPRHGGWRMPGTCKIRQIEPERGSQPIECSVLMTGQGVREAVAKGPAHSEARVLDALPIPADLALHQGLRGVNRRYRGTEVHQPLPVDGGGFVRAVRRIGARLVGVHEEPCDQLPVRELVAEEVLHERTSAAHHGCREGRSLKRERGRRLMEGESRGIDAGAGRCDALRAGNAAAVRVMHDLAVQTDANDHHVVSLKLWQQGDVAS